MTDRPTLSWTWEPGALYTVILSDEGVPEGKLPEGTDYIHWMVTNIPGNRILDGVEVMRYVEPFVAGADDDAHPYLALVFKQGGRVRLEETQRGCSPSLLTDRALNKHSTLVEKYGMEVVAGTWFQVPYSGRATEQMLCYYTRCTRAPFPAPLPGTSVLDCWLIAVARYQRRCRVPAQHRGV